MRHGEEQMGKIRVNVRKKKRARIVTPSQSKLTLAQREFLDYKDVETLSKFVSGVGKILPRKRSGATAAEQRRISEAVKLARFMALLPYVAK